MDGIDGIRRRRLGPLEAGGRPGELGGPRERLGLLGPALAELRQLTDARLDPLAVAGFCPGAEACDSGQRQEEGRSHEGRDGPTRWAQQKPQPRKRQDGLHQEDGHERKRSRHFLVGGQRCAQGAMVQQKPRENQQQTGYPEQG